MNEILQSKLMEMFILKDFMACNKWLPLNPRRQAFEDYRNDVAVRCRINENVEEILEVIERYGGLRSKED